MIRNATAQDFDFIFGLYMHPEINPYLLYEPMEKIEFRPIFDDLLASGVLYIFSVNGLDSGMFKLIQLQHRTSHIAYLGGVAIATEMAGKKLGTTMFEEILAFARGKQIRRIELSVATHNHRAIKLYEKSGFQREGILRQYTHLRQEDRYIDEQLMACLLS
jgi:putative acetyltransferase